MPDREFTFSSSCDGLPIQAYGWACAEPRGLVVIAHGMAEHALRYERFARALTAAGFSAYALDHRGHGRSPGPGGLGDFGAGGWSALVGDLGQLIELVRAEHASPVALFAHSMGSFAAQQYCYTHSARIDALVLSGSSAWELDSEGRRAAPFEPNRAFEPARTPYDWLSRDQAEVDKYIADPLCGFETQSGRTRGSRIDWRTLNDPAGAQGIRADLPVLLLAGDQDPVHRQLAGLQLLERRWCAAGVARIDTRYYAGGRHEMLNETNRDEVTRDIVGWLEAVLR